MSLDLAAVDYYRTGNILFTDFGLSGVAAGIVDPAAVGCRCAIFYRTAGQNQRAVFHIHAAAVGRAVVRYDSTV